jgi:hypothetical protein
MGSICACDAGYRGDGATCSDIDECLTNNGGCGPVEFNRCTNNPGGPATCVELALDHTQMPDPSKQAFMAAPQHDNLNGALINAYAMSPARCSTTPAVTKSWQHNIDLRDYKSKNAFDLFGMGPNEALSYKFVAYTEDASGGFIYNDNAIALVRPTFISITTTPCDFDVSKLVVGPGRDPCYQTGINGNSINWVNTSLVNPAYCHIVKGQTYYVNLRFQDGRPASEGGTPTSDACPVGAVCGGLFQML